MRRSLRESYALRCGCYPPARWRGGSSEAAKLPSEGWEDYACSEYAIGAYTACPAQAAPPPPRPSPPLASLAGGGEPSVPWRGSAREPVVDRLAQSLARDR